MAYPRLAKASILGMKSPVVMPRLPHNKTECVRTRSLVVGRRSSIEQVSKVMLCKAVSERQTNEAVQVSINHNQERHLFITNELSSVHVTLKSRRTPSKQASRIKLYATSHNLACRQGQEDPSCHMMFCSRLSSSSSWRATTQNKHCNKLRPGLCSQRPVPKKRSGYALREQPGQE